MHLPSVFVSPTHLLLLLPYLAYALSYTRICSCLTLFMLYFLPTHLLLLLLYLAHALSITLGIGY